MACKGIAFIYDANNRNNNSKLDDIYRKNSFAMWAKEFFLMWLYTIRCMRLSCRDNQEDDCKVSSVFQYVSSLNSLTTNSYLGFCSLNRCVHINLSLLFLQYNSLRSNFLSNRSHSASFLLHSFCRPLYSSWKGMMEASIDFNTIGSSGAIVLLSFIISSITESTSAIVWNKWYGGVYVDKWLPKYITWLPN